MFPSLLTNKLYPDVLFGWTLSLSGERMGMRMPAQPPPPNNLPGKCPCIHLIPMISSAAFGMLLIMRREYVRELVLCICMEQLHGDRVGGHILEGVTHSSLSYLFLSHFGSAHTEGYLHIANMYSHCLTHIKPLNAKPKSELQITTHLQ